MTNQNTIDGASIGRRIRAARFVRGMTMRALADESGVFYRTLMELENGKTQHPNARTVQRIAQALGVEVTALLVGNEDGDAIAE